MPIEKKCNATSVISFFVSSFLTDRFLFAVVQKMEGSFKERGRIGGTGTKKAGGPSVRQRVEQTEARTSQAELVIQQQTVLIEDLKEQNSELIHAIAIFKSKMEETLAIEVDRVSKDMKVKHGVLKAKNKQLSDLVIEQKAEKEMLIAMVETLDSKLASLEDSVGI